MGHEVWTFCFQNMFTLFSCFHPFLYKGNILFGPRFLHLAPRLSLPILLDSTSFRFTTLSAPNFTFPLLPVSHSNSSKVPALYTTRFQLPLLPVSNYYASRFLLPLLPGPSPCAPRIQIAVLQGFNALCIKVPTPTIPKFQLPLFHGAISLHSQVPTLSAPRI